MQLTVEDAKLHPDTLMLQQFVNRKLGSWSALALERKVELAPLFLPGITRAELFGAMGTSTLLDEVVREAPALVTFWWPEGSIQGTGELFFEIDDDNVYTLDPVEALAS